MKGSMQQRQPGAWRLRVYLGRDPVTGAKQHASETFRGTQRQAETALARFVARMDAGERGGAATMTVAGLLVAFCDHSEDVGKSPTTVAEYRRLAGNLRDGIGRTKLTKLRSQEVDALYSALGARGVPGGRGALSPASVNRYHDLLKSACRQAVKWGLIETSPIERATPPSEPRAKMTAPTPDELRLLIDRAAELAPAHGLLVALAAMTGARRGELCALRWSDVDLDDGVVHIRRALKQVGQAVIEGDTKTHQERAVAVPPAAVAMLGAFQCQLEEDAEKRAIPLARDPFVFSPAPDHGRPYLPSSIGQMFYRVARKVGLPYHLHQLRHFAATQLIAAGHDPVTVGNRLGHADPSVTLRVYAHAIQDRDRAAGDALGEIVSPRQITKGADE